MSVAVSFEAGDLLLAASDVDDREVDLRNHRGPGRILHLSADFTPKSILWTGVEGLLVGIAVDPADGTIWGADPTARQLSHLGRNGDTLSLPEGLPTRPYGTVVFDASNRMLLCVHTQRGPAPEDAFGSAQILRMEDSGWRGFNVETDGGHSGFHRVSSLALDGDVAVYLAEGGRHVFRHDLATDTPLPPLFVFDTDSGKRVFGVAALPDGYLVATGSGVLRLDREGVALAEWNAASPKGWTRVTRMADGATFLFNNFLEGIIERRSLSDGSVMNRYDIGRKCALCGVAEII